MPIFSILMFPASEGDCLLVEYGEPDAIRRILIDGGRKATYDNHLRRYLEAIPEARRRLRLFVVTHIDRDHIEGALALLQDTLPLAVDDVWFNGYANLLGDAPPPLASAGARQGESLTALVQHRKWPRNLEFGTGAVSTGNPAKPRPVDLGHSMTLTLLGPSRADLKKLEPQWRAECRKAGIMPGGGNPAGPVAPPLPTAGGGGMPEPEELAAAVTPIDGSAPNGSSITFLLSYAGKSVLFCADARPAAMRSALGLLGAKPGQPLQVHAVKVPHHGSKANVTQELFACIRSPRYLVSTDGVLTGHPDPEGVARIVMAAGDRRRLYFNYANQRTLLWDRADWKQRLGYDTEYGDGLHPLAVNVLTAL